MRGAVEPSRETAIKVKLVGRPLNRSIDRPPPLTTTAFAAVVIVSCATRRMHGWLVKEGGNWLLAHSNEVVRFWTAVFSLWKWNRQRRRSEGARVLVLQR